MSILKQLAREVFHSGLSFEDALTDLVAAERNAALDRSKHSLRKGVDRVVVRQLLIDEGVPAAIATDVVIDAAVAVGKEKAHNELVQKSTLHAQSLFRNHIAHATVVDLLLAEGCDRDLATKIANENQHLYR